MPKPFTRVVVSYGEPIYIPGKLTEQEFEDQKQRVQKAMEENIERCQAHIRALKDK